MEPQGCSEWGVWGQNGKNMWFFVVNQHFSPSKHTTAPKNYL